MDKEGGKGEGGERGVVVACLLSCVFNQQRAASYATKARCWTLFTGAEVLSSLVVSTVINAAALRGPFMVVLFYVYHRRHGTGGQCAMHQCRPCN